MAGYIVTGEAVDESTRTHFIPRHARYSVFSCPDEYQVVKGTANGKSIALDLDPGKYRIKIVKPGVCNWGKVFFVEMTEPEWKRLETRKTRWAKVSHTTQGIRWTCKLCSETNMTKHGAIMHEFRDHLGIDPLQATDEEVDDALGSAQPMGGVPKDVSAIPPLTQRSPRTAKPDSATA